MSAPRQLALPLNEVSVHCFTCEYVVIDASPFRAHDRMEEHYRAKHSALIAKLADGAA